MNLLEMDKRSKNLTYLYFLLVFLVLTTVPCALVKAVPHLTVTAYENMIDIEAEQIPINDVFKAIATETGLSITSSRDLTDKISLSIRNTSVETAIRRVLSKQDYFMLVDRDADGRLVSVSLRVAGGGLEDALEIGPESSAHSPDDHMKRVERDWIAQTFSGSDKLLKQISAVSIKDGSDSQGIRITKIAKDSPFREIGIQENDIIRDVNGHPVKTMKELVYAVNDTSNDLDTNPPIIRIERLNSDGMIDPIYIEME